MTWSRDEFYLAGCSEVGTKHLSAQQPCADSHFVARDGESFVLVACDGAGSRKHASIGARAVAVQVGELLLRNAEDFMARSIGGKTVLSVARASVAAASMESGGSPDDYACTLVALLIHEGHLITCHVGDGAIFVLEGEHPRLLSAPQRDGRGTYFVTTDGVRPRMWKRRLEHYMTGFLVVTDGADALANTVTGEVSQLVGRFVNTLDLGSEREAADFLREACRSTLSPKTEDDITLVAARRAYAAGRYGCTECHWPDVWLGWSRTGCVYFGKCPRCAHILLYTDDPRRIRTYEFLRSEGQLISGS